MLKHTLAIRKNIIVPKAQVSKTTLDEIGVSAAISQIFGVLAAVYLNDDLVLEAHEIDRPRPNRRLTSKFDVAKLA